MTIELTPQHQRIIDDAIHSGAFHNAAEVISAALESFAGELDDAPVSKTREQEPAAPFDAVRTEIRERAIEKLRLFGKTHGLSLGGITLRQLRDEARP